MFLDLPSLRSRRRVGLFTRSMEGNGLLCETAYWMQPQIPLPLLSTRNRCVHSFGPWMHLSNFAPLSKQQFPSLPQLLGSFHFRRTSLRVPSRLRAISVSLDTLTSIHTYFAFYTDDEISDLFVPTIPQSVYPFLQEIFQILIRQSPRTIHSLSSFPSNQTQPIVFSFHPFHCRAFWVFTRSVACLTVDMTHLCSDR